MPWQKVCNDFPLECASVITWAVMPCKLGRRARPGLEEQFESK